MQCILYSIGIYIIPNDWNARKTVIKNIRTYISSLDYTGVRISKTTIFNEINGNPSLFYVISITIADRLLQVKQIPLVLIKRISKLSP